MSAGKATRDRTRSMAAAVRAKRKRTKTPTAMGSSISSRFCTKSRPTGRWISEASAPDTPTANCMMGGMVRSVMTLLKAVSVTDRATSPPANLEKMFDELPPGEQAISTSPTKKTGGSAKAMPSAKATAGKTTICPTNPTATARGRRRKSRKSAGWSVSPRSNMSRVSIGSTIRIGFIASPHQSTSIACAPESPSASAPDRAGT